MSEMHLYDPSAAGFRPARTTDFRMGYDAQDDMMKVKSVQKKFRDSFIGAAIDSTKWASAVGTGGSITVSGGQLTMASGTTASATTSITSVDTFTVPFRIQFHL